MSTSSPLKACSKFFPVLLFLAGTFAASASLQAQTAAPAASAKPPATASTTASGFSIETEMLTYRALETNGEAIACDVASYLENVKTSFQSASGGPICNVPSVTGTSSVGVVILPFDRTVFNDFLIWRSDMQTMAEFETRGATACEAKPAPASAEQPNRPPPGVSGRGLTAPAGVAGMFTPAGAAISTAQGVLGLFAKSQAAEPVGGTIQDQAFMDNVARELRTINLSVLMPDVYTPYAYSSIDATHAPFLIALDKLLHLRDCLVNNKSSEDPDVKDIDAFLASLSGGESSTPSRQPVSNTGASTASTATPAPASSTTPSRLESALSADGLAQRLGADPNTGQIPATAPHHVLMIKALESGGSVNHSTSIFGTKMSYSGGSVGTYALFNLDGELECSGNVYNYAGPIAAGNFEKNLTNFKPSPGDEVIFQRGSCTPLH